MSGVQRLAANDKSNKEACLQEIYVIDRIIASDVRELAEDQAKEVSDTLHDPFKCWIYY